MLPRRFSAKPFAREPDTELRLCQCNYPSYAAAEDFGRIFFARDVDDARTQRRDAATMQRRNDVTPQRCNTATVERRNDTTTERRNHATTQRRDEATTQQRNAAVLSSPGDFFSCPTAHRHAFLRCASVHTCIAVLLPCAPGSMHPASQDVRREIKKVSSTLNQ